MTQNDTSPTQYNTKQENDIYFFTFQKTFSAVVERYVSYVKKLNIENPMNRFLYILLAETATEYLNIVKRYNFMNMALNEEQTYSIDNDGNNVKDLIYGIYVTPENKIENSRTLQYENYKTLGIVNHYKTKNQNKLTA